MPNPQNNLRPANNFSWRVYDTNPPPLPKGWVNFLSSSKEDDAKWGFYAQSFLAMDASPDGVLINISIRGTANIENVVDDARLFFLKEVPKQFWHAAIPFVLNLLLYLRTFSPDKMKFHISFNGHSLGAIIAQLLLAVLKHLQKTSNFDPLFNKAKNFLPEDTFDFLNSQREELTEILHKIIINNAIIFEQPGSKELLQDLLNDGIIDTETIIQTTLSTKAAFNRDPNPITTALEKIESALSPNVIGYNFNRYENCLFPFPNPIELVEVITAYTADQHSMKDIYEFLEKNPDYQLKQNPKFVWPSWDEALKYFLEYRPSGKWDNISHTGFWNGYIRNCWDAHPEIHKQFDNQFRLFANEFIYVYLHANRKAFEDYRKTNPSQHFDLKTAKEYFSKIDFNTYLNEARAQQIKNADTNKFFSIHKPEDENNSCFGFLKKVLFK